jgi:hypothetical protein
LDWRTAVDSLQSESAGPTQHVGHSGLSPLGNLRWYLGSAIPEALTWPLVALAAAGVVLVLLRRRPPQLLLVAFCAIFLAGVCASSSHWIRWVLQILPLLVLFAAAAVDTMIRRLTAAFPRVSRSSLLVPAALVAVTAVFAVHPIGELLATNRYDNGSPSTSEATRRAARDWIMANIPPGSQILADTETVSLDDAHFVVHYALNPRTHKLADYQNAGHQYIVVNGLRSGIYRLGAPHYPREAAFYQDVACHTRLVASIAGAPQQLRNGWPIRIYQLDKPPREVSGVLCTQQADN